MAGRFIKLYDKILSWEWFSHPNTLCLFIYLLLKAYYKDTAIGGKVIHRGQLVTSLPKISTDTGLSIQQARTAIAHLVSTGEITDESSNQNRIITIVKYDDYQNATDGSTGKQQASNRRVNRQSTDDSTPYIEYIENIEDIEKDRIIPPISPKGGKTQADDSFSVFWEAYPKKVSKPDALKAWKKLKPDAGLLKAIMDGLSRWKESDQWNRDNGQYIPYPATWLNKQKWEDEISTAPVRKDPAPAKVVSAVKYEQRDYGDEDNLAYQRMIQEWRNG